ncbi:MAG: glycosyltransferase [Cyanobacteria bacterium P01_F01_bin.3]
MFLSLQSPSLPSLPSLVFLQLQQVAADKPNVTLRRYTSRFLDYLNQADLSISLGGYNTTMNLLSTGVRSLLLPSLNPSQTDEQRIRGEKLASMGVVNLLSAEDLHPERLTGAIASAMSQQPVPHGINLQGAMSTAAYLKSLLLEESTLMQPEAVAV